MKRFHGLNLSIICLIFSVVCMIIGLFGYRQNLTNAYAKEAQILALDTAGQDTTSSVQDLKTYTESHMHADVSFWLEQSYTRAVASAQAKSTATQTSTADSNLYAAAQASCSGHTDSVTQATCVTAYVSAHPAATTTPPTPVELPTKTAFTYNFVSPSWSWDAAGISFLLGGAGLIAAIVLALKHK
jgi:hypothetical protein